MSEKSNVLRCFINCAFQNAGLLFSIILNFANTLPGLSILEICSRVLLITATKHDGEESKAQKFGAMLEFMGRQNITGHLEMLPAGGASVE